MRKRVRTGIYEFLYRRRLTPWAQRVFRLFGSWRPLDRPIFVVGMQRSGTSFLRDCLVTSSEIASYGEMNDMWDPLGFPWQSARRPRPYWFLEPQAYIDAVYADVGRDYYQAVPGICAMRVWAEQGRSAGVRFINKCPMNTLRIPLLRELFPNAHFVSIVRNPLAVIRSAAEKIALKLEKHKSSGVRRRADGTIDYNFDGKRFSWKQAIDRFSETYCYVLARQLSELESIDEAQKNCITYESFVGDIHGTLRAIDAKCELDPQQRNWHSIPPFQASRNDKYRKQFDAQTMDIILGRCSSLMTTLGYSVRRLAG